ncbi:MAG: DUF6263 family protein [Myxococcota bacterium]
MIRFFPRGLRAVAVLLLAFVATAALSVTAPFRASADDTQIVSTGQGPKRALRLAPQVGSTQVTDFVMTMHMKMVAPMPMDQSLPGMKFGMRTAVTSVAPNGDITYNLEVIDSSVVSEGVDPNMVQMLNAQVQSIVGTKATITINNRGEAISADFTPSPNAPPEVVANLQKSLDRSATRLPEPEVGVGAKWVETANIEENGLKVLQKTTYELTSLKGDLAEIKVSIVQTGTPGPLTDPNLPPGAEAKLESLSGSASGMSTLNMAHPTEAKAVLDLTVNTKMTMTMNGAEQKMEMGMSVKTEVSRR